MEESVDKIMSVIESWMNTLSEDGGIADVLEFASVYFGDPGVLPAFSYPAITVQGAKDTPEMETTGYEAVDLTILVTLMIDAREFFNKSVEEATGDRALINAASSLRRWLRRDSNRSLDGTVRQMKVITTDYLPEARGEIITKSAQLTLVVNRQYQRQQ